MFCEDIKNLMIKHFDEGLNIEERKTLNQHLDVCEKCKLDFEELEKMFSTLEIENQFLLESREPYFRLLNPLEIVQRKSRRKWFTFNLNPAFSLVAVILVAFTIFFYLSDKPVNQTNNFSSAEQKQNNESVTETTYEDDISFYLNQDYLIDNVEVNDLTKSSYFDDALNLLREFQNQLISNLNDEHYYISTIDYLSDNEIDEIISQLKTKKF